MLITKYSCSNSKFLCSQPFLLYGMEELRIIYLKNLPMWLISFVEIILIY